MDLAKAHVLDQQFDKIFDIEKGYLIGTIFPCLDDNLKYKKTKTFKPTEERQKILYMIDCYSFALNDLVLYLDTHPDCQKALDLSNQIRVELIKMFNYYNSNFPALTMFSAKNTYDYINCPWPWGVSNTTNSS